MTDEMLLTAKRIGSIVFTVFAFYLDTSNSLSAIFGQAVARQQNMYQLNYARYAIDGNLTTYSTTYDGKNPRTETHGWWQVDLISNFTITGVALTGRLDSVDDQYLADFTILVGVNDSTDGSVPRCTYYNSTTQIPKTSYPHFLPCDQPDPVSGRYLTIRREGRGIRPDALTLVEVEIYGSPFTSTTPTTTTTTTATTAPTEPTTHPRITSTQSTSQAYAGPSAYQTNAVTGISPTSSCSCCTGSNAASAPDHFNSNLSNNTTLIIIIIVLGCVLFISLCIHVIIIIVYNVKIRQLMKKINYLSNFETSQESELYDNDIQFEPDVEYHVYSTIRTIGQRSSRRRHPGLNAMSQFNARRRSQPKFPDYYSASTFKRPQFNDNRRSDDFTIDYPQPN